MAVTNEQIVFAIEANTKAVESGLNKLEVALKDVNGEFKKSADSSGKAEDSFSKFGASVVVLNQAIELSKKVFTALVGPLEKSVAEFLVADQSITRLKNSLKLVGTDNIEQATKDFEDFAASIQNTTTIADDTVLQLAAQAKAIGLTDDATKKLITSSIDLAAANGGDVVSSFDALLGSYKGQGRALAKYSQELAMVTEAEFKAGKGIEVIGQKFKGFGAGEINTISGAFKQFNNIVGDVFEDVGKTVAKGFDFKGILIEAKNLAVNLKSDFQDVSNTITPLFVNMGQVIKASLRTVGQLDVGALLTAFTAISAAGVLAFTLIQGASIRAAVTSAAAWAAANAPFAILTASILAVATAIEVLIRNFGNLGNIVSLIMTGQFKKAFEETNFGIAGDAINSLKTAVTGFGSNLKDVQDEAKKASKATESIGDSGKKAASGLAVISVQGRQMLDDLAAKVEEVKRKNASIGAGVTEVINLQVKADQASLDVIKKKLIAEGAYNATAKKNLQELNALYAQGGQVQVAENQRKALEEITNQTKDLALETAKKDALTIDGIELQLQRQLELIDLKEKQLEKDSMLTDAMKAQINSQKELRKLQATQAKAEAPTAAFEGPVKAGQQIARDISNSFSGLLGMTNAVMAITGAINSVVDAIPSALNAISGTINKITNFPTELANSVVGLTDALSNFLTNFPEIVMKAVDNITNALFGFLDKLPQMIDQFFAKLPQAIQKIQEAIPALIIKIMESLPSIIQSLIRGLLTAMPKIAVSFTMTIAKNLPKILLASMQAIFIEIPKAIVQGIRDALFGFTDEFVDSLTDIDIIDPKEIGGQIKKLTGEASRLFKVSDLTEGVADPVKDGLAKINKAVSDGLSKIKGLWAYFIEALNAAWMWVRENIIDPLINIVMIAFQWVIDNVLRPMATFVMKAFQWVIDKVLNPIMRIVMVAWQWVVDNVLNPIFRIVTGAFQWVLDKVIMPIANFIREAFSFGAQIVLSVFQKIPEFFNNAIAGFKSLFEEIGNLFSGIFSIFQKGLGLILNPFIDLINALKIPGVSIGPIGGSIYNPFGSDWDFELIGRKELLPDIDLIPGNIPRLAEGGILKGNAPFLGNSELNDKILAMLSPGEAVIPRDKMADPNISALVGAILGDKLKLPQFAEGGMTSSFGSSIAGTLASNEVRTNNPQAVSSNQVFDIKINITNNDKMDDNFVRNKLVPTIKNELKRASLDGQFILDAKGIRR